MGFITGRDLRGQPIDILGFGLIGTPGVIKYFTGVGLVLAAFVADSSSHATRRVLDAANRAAGLEDSGSRPRHWKSWRWHGWPGR